ncbi:hypothetical protein H4R18_002413 [Coemansia javaensis]|uniref:O-methyltransferase n=1 Tax=Coemansia javaensis TaxID=2761396 RepID=A0A9W8LK25_9FUNG|nr:hypothetical protein H4R18_002413 [Coemansia javaensis]
MAFTITTAEREELQGASEDVVRLHYAAQVSDNPNLATPSVPPVVRQIHKDTVAQFGEEKAYMVVSHYQGILHGFLVGLTGARRVLEIGTFTGSSAIFFANALKRNGVPGGGADGGSGSSGHKPVVSLEISERHAASARKQVAAAGLDDYIEVVVGDARQSLAGLAGQVFDVAFLDADKTSYRHYYDTIIEAGLVPSGGLIIADNTAFNCTTPFIGLPAPVPGDARPLDVPFPLGPLSEDAGRRIHEFNEHVRHDPRTEVVMLPLFTGISLIRIL